MPEQSGHETLESIIAWVIVGAVAIVGAVVILTVFALVAQALILAFGAIGLVYTIGSLTD
jgi:hypothetical protein